ncbi:MAG: hypothetical protein ABI835_17005, partial [Chloroflexota bacterium]
MLKKMAAVFTALFLLGVSTTAAQDNRTVFWQRWDVVVDQVNTSDNQYNVTEIYDMEFGGRFTFGSRVIETEGMDGIGNVRVSQDGQPLAAGCAQRPGTYCVSSASGEVS